MSSIWAKECMFDDCVCYLTLHYYPSLVEGESHAILYYYYYILYYYYYIARYIFGSEQRWIRVYRRSPVSSGASEFTVDV